MNKRNIVMWYDVPVHVFLCELKELKQTWPIRSSDEIFVLPIVLVSCFSKCSPRNPLGVEMALVLPTTGQIFCLNGEIPNPESAKLKEIQESGSGSYHERQRKRFVEDWFIVQLQRDMRTLLRILGNRTFSAQKSRSTQNDGVLQGFMINRHAFREAVLEELMHSCRWTAAEGLMLNALWQSGVSPGRLCSSIHPMEKAASADQGCPPALITSLQIIMDLLAVRVGLLNLWRNTTVHNH